MKKGEGGGTGVKMEIKKTNGETYIRNEEDSTSNEGKGRNDKVKGEKRDRGV